MAKSQVGPWAADKLDRLGKYLHAYTTIMKDQSKWCNGFYYIDAFAGPGAHEVRADCASVSFTSQLLLEVAEFGQADNEQKEFIAGSPMVALDLQHPFTHYVFIEKNPDRVEELKQLQVKYHGVRKMSIHQEDCTGYLLRSVVNNRLINWKTHRAVVFLDPFGMQVDWATIEAIASTRAIEVFLNFPVGMAIQRLLRRNPENFSAAQRQKLDGYFGSSDWYPALYKKARTLFDDDIDAKIEQSGAALVKWYRERLREIFGYVSKAALIRNTRGGHLYYLLLASPNETGAKIASQILSAGEAI